MTSRFAYTSLLVADDGRPLRAVTSAIHLDIGAAARAAEISEPPERGIDWFPGVLDRRDWLIGLAVDHSPSTEGTPYLGVRLVHPSDTTEYEIRSVWSQIRSSKTFLVELNELREERGLEVEQAPRFDTTPAPTPTYPRI
ncbi:hypothetical protein [Gordonia terrae]